MPDLVELFSRSTGRLTERIAGVDPAAWTAPTPCSDWDVRALVNHVTYEQLWAPHLVAGETVADVGDRYDGDVLGDDPATAWRDALAGSVSAFAGADLDAIVHLSFADLPCREYLIQMLTDAEIHGWDLARATGQDEALDPDVTEVVLASVVANEALIRASGVFGDEVEVPDDADDPTKLLALLGRRA